MSLTVITEVHHHQDPYYHEKELIPRFLEAATYFKGEIRERVMPAILFTYFNGVDLSNLTSVATRFINVSQEQGGARAIDSRLIASTNR